MIGHVHLSANYRLVGDRSGYGRSQITVVCGSAGRRSERNRERNTVRDSVSVASQRATNTEIIAKRGNFALRVAGRRFPPSGSGCGWLACGRTWTASPSGTSCS